MQASLSPLGGKHYRHYSQLFRVHNALGEYFKYEGICHYNKNKSQNLERDLEGEREIKECVSGAFGFQQHPTKTFSSFSFSSSLKVRQSFSLEKKNFCNSIRKFTWSVCPCVIWWILLKCYKSLILAFSKD